MNLDHNAQAVTAAQLNAAFVGEAFSYETSEGVPVYGRLAFAEVGPTKVLVTLDGVLHEGSSVVLTLAPEDELWFNRATI
ncbi:hypothetical protein GA0115240_12237 [Streptomyces sp. DvalAA-14]|uniref:hypothetical protein n=1 Tax=unclassified Streptomyces TaxID=2593676 RepID=UPI00081B62D2|nr:MULTISPECIES: hypothetical protein [unclassified Streptomyces]MYS20692.1 hypothetical protein [Streptomyces sp. SID4948]SCD74857.1 hypothetical protein GA0115240_12237 [Streptomyces sp. DvalAA-14]